MRRTLEPSPRCPHWPNRDPVWPTAESGLVAASTPGPHRRQPERARPEHVQRAAEPALTAPPTSEQLRAAGGLASSCPTSTLRRVVPGPVRRSRLPTPSTRPAPRLRREDT